MDFEQELERVAQEYRSDGYAVTLHPKSDQLPPFASSLRVDLLATRTDGNVLVRVLRDRSQLEADPDVPRQAEVTNEQPGWSYDLVVLEQDNPIRRTARTGEPSLEQIQEMLAEAEMVAQAGSLRAGFVLAWGGLEAALRRLAHQAGFSDVTGTQTTVVIRELYGNGRISTGDFVQIEKMRRLRMAIVHGLAPPPLDAGMVQALLAMARRVLATSESTQAAAG
jgi:hypothetical protein